ncbi:hypothetical protein UT300005_34980 [Clostridium sp. CTA-5]
MSMVLLIQLVKECIIVKSIKKGHMKRNKIYQYPISILSQALKINTLSYPYNYFSI